MELYCELSIPFFAASMLSACPCTVKVHWKIGHFFFLFSFSIFFSIIFDVLRTTLGLLVVNPQIYCFYMVANIPVIVVY